MAKLRIDNGWLIPIDGRRDVVERGAVLIEDGRIVAAGPRDEIRGAADTTIDATGKAILPGFVNTHIHLIGALNKALTEDVPGVSGGLFKIAMPIHFKYLELGDVYWPAVIHALEFLRTGTTTINEVGRFEREVVKAVRDVGLRAVMAETIRETDVMRVRPGITEREFDADAGQRCIDTALEFIDEWHGAAGGRITCRLGPHAPDTCSPRTLMRIKDLAEQRGLGLHMHVAQVPGETEYIRKAHGKTSVAYLTELGYVSPKLIAVHCVFMTPDDVQLMVERGAHMSHTAYLVGKRGYFPPMTEAYRRGLSVSLGADWLSNDMFKIMRSAIILARQQAHSSDVLDARRALHMATIGGACALGLDAEIGSLEPGKRADLFLLNLRTPWMYPIRPQQLITNIVYNANGSDVTHVIVDGRVVVADGRSLSIDDDLALDESQKAAGAVWQRAADLFTD